MAKKDTSYVIKKIKSDAEQALSDISDSVTEVSSEINDSINSAARDLLDNSEKNHNKIISAEEKYMQEKLRIEEKRKAQSAQIAEQEFNQKISSVKDASKAALMIEKENIRLEKLADEEYLQELKKQAEEEALIREKEFSDLKNSLDLGYITQEEYYERLGALRDKYFSSDSAEWVKYTKQINNYHIDALNELKDYISSSQKELDNLQSKIQSKLSDYEDLYTKKTVTYKDAGPLGTDLVFTSATLNDLTAQTQTLRKYADTLEAVKKRGELPEGFFAELRNMSIDKGLEFANTLLSASESEFEEYITSYAEKQAEIARISAELTENEAAQMINSISSELEKYYDSIPEGFFDCGKLSGESFTNAFLSALEGLSGGLNSLFPMSDAFSSSNNPSQNNSYSSVYNLYSNAQTASEQLREARAASELEKIRGGY